MAPTFDFDRTLRRLRMRHLELLELLGEERTVRAAAARMALTQPALSKMLREIEDCFVASMFEPLMVANDHAHEDDRFNTVAALRMARTVMAQPAMQRWLVREDRPGPVAQGDEALLHHAKSIGQTSYHPVGSWRMGIDEASVVDQRLRVGGLHGLRVTDASIFPTMPSANTDAPAMMVGERAAQFMLQAAQDG
jgi:choline dehydrogenase-like flavoprotein